MTAIREVLHDHLSDEDMVSRLETALVEREDGIADMLRMAGAQFGLFPEIVAEVIASIEIGTPLPPSERAMVRQQYITLMERLREQQSGD